MDEQYTKEDLSNDLDALASIGLIEIVGIDPNGQWLWGPTEKGLSLSSEEVEELIRKTFD